MMGAQNRKTWAARLGVLVVVTAALGAPSGAEATTAGHETCLPMVRSCPQGIDLFHFAELPACPGKKARPGYLAAVDDCTDAACTAGGSSVRVQLRCGKTGWQVAMNNGTGPAAGASAAAPFVVFGHANDLTGAHDLSEDPGGALLNAPGSPPAIYSGTACGGGKAVASLTPGIAANCTPERVLGPSDVNTSDALRALVNDETGAGAVVFNDRPNLNLPRIQSYPIATLPPPNPPGGALAVVNDSVAPGDCQVGGNATPTYTLCRDNGVQWLPVGGGGGGGSGGGTGDVVSLVSSAELGALAIAGDTTGKRQRFAGCHATDVNVDPAGILCPRPAVVGSCKLWQEPAAAGSKDVVWCAPDGGFTGMSQTRTFRFNADGTTPADAIEDANVAHRGLAARFDPNDGHVTPVTTQPDCQPGTVVIGQNPDLTLKCGAGGGLVLLYARGEDSGAIGASSTAELDLSPLPQTIPAPPAGRSWDFRFVGTASTAAGTPTYRISYGSAELFAVALAGLPAGPVGYATRVACQVRAAGSAGSVACAGTFDVDDATATDGVHTKGLILTPAAVTVDLSAPAVLKTTVQFSSSNSGNAFNEKEGNIYQGDALQVAGLPTTTTTSTVPTTTSSSSTSSTSTTSTSSITTTSVTTTTSTTVTTTTSTTSTTILAACTTTAVANTPNVVSSPYLQGNVYASGPTLVPRQRVDNASSLTVCELDLCVAGYNGTPTGHVEARIYSDKTTGCPRTCSTDPWATCTADGDCGAGTCQSAPASCPDQPIGGPSDPLDITGVTSGWTFTSAPCGDADNGHGKLKTFAWSTNKPTPTGVFWIVTYQVDANVWVKFGRAGNTYGGTAFSNWWRNQDQVGDLFFAVRVQ
jgi:hypothetical protein